MSEQRKGKRFAGFSSNLDTAAGQQGSLELLGLPSTVFNDAGTALFIDQERHLLPWFGDQTNLVDRYDVRLLLDDLSACDEPARPAALFCIELEGQEAAALHAERYADLDCSRELVNEAGGGLREDSIYSDGSEGGGSDDSSEDDISNSSRGESESDSGSEDAPLPPPPLSARKSATPPPMQLLVQGPVQSPAPAEAAAPTAAEAAADEAEASAAARERAAAPAYTAVGFSYESELQPEAEEEAACNGTANQVPAMTEPPDPYVPHYQVPHHLQPALPTTERQHKIMIETARFVRKGGGQVEVLLRVRQARNPTFDFLLPGNPGYPYYRWIVEANPKELEPPPGIAPAVAGPQPAPQAAPTSVQAEGLLNLLSFYANEEEDRGQGTGGDESRLEGDKQHAGAGPGRASPAPASQAAAATEATQGAEAPTPESFTAGVQGPAAEAATAEPQGAEAPAAGPSAAAEPPAPGCEPAEPPAGAEGEETRGTTPEPGGDEDARAIMSKLTLFAKRSGARFEATVRQRKATNPRFAFLLPWNKHHAAYKALLAESLGSTEAADKLLAESLAIVADAKARQQQARGSAAPAAVTLTSQGPVFGPVTKPVFLKANPRLSVQQPARQEEPVVGSTSPARKHATAPEPPAARTVAAAVAAAASAAGAAPAAAADADTAAAPADADAASGGKGAEREDNSADESTSSSSSSSTNSSDSSSPSRQRRANAQKCASPQVQQPPIVAQQQQQQPRKLPVFETGPARALATEAAPDGEGEVERAAALQAAAQGDMNPAQRMMERRLRARKLLAVKMAEKAREEVLQRQQAVINHRQFFLSEDDAQGMDELLDNETPQQWGNKGAHSPEYVYEAEEGEVLPPEAIARAKASEASRQQRTGRPFHREPPQKQQGTATAPSPKPASQTDQDLDLLQELDQQWDKQLSPSTGKPLASASERADAVAKHLAALQQHEGGKQRSEGVVDHAVPASAAALQGRAVAQGSGAIGPPVAAASAKPGGLKEAVAAAVAAATAGLARKPQAGPRAAPELKPKSSSSSNNSSSVSSKENSGGEEDVASSNSNRSEARERKRDGERRSEKKRHRKKRRRSEDDGEEDERASEGRQCRSRSEDDSREEGRGERHSSRSWRRKHHGSKHRSRSRSRSHSRRGKHRHSHKRRKKKESEGGKSRRVEEEGEKDKKTSRRHHDGIYEKERERDESEGEEGGDGSRKSKRRSPGHRKKKRSKRHHKNKSSKSKRRRTHAEEREQEGVGNRRSPSHIVIHYDLCSSREPASIKASLASQQDDCSSSSSSSSGQKLEDKQRYIQQSVPSDNASKGGDIGSQGVGGKPAGSESGEGKLRSRLRELLGSRGYS